MKRTALLASALLMASALSGCGLHPLYAGGGNGAIARGLAAVDVSAIEGKNGWLMHNALVDQLGAGNAGGPVRYRLDVRLDDKLEGSAVLSDDTVSRERRTLRARFQLVDNSSGAIVLDSTAGSDEGIDVVGSDYATIAAEQTALENLTREVANQIVTSVALHLRSNAASAK
jgi:LPS-assembly lipoprotein